MIMNSFDIIQPWAEGSFFMTRFQIENYASESTIEKVVDDLADSCLVADQAINKAMKK